MTIDLGFLSLVFIYCVAFFGTIALAYCLVSWAAAWFMRKVRDGNP